MQASTTTFAKFKILVGDGGSPEVFSAVCGLTSKGLSGAATTVKSAVPDCANEDLPSYEEVDVASIGLSLSGDGMWSVQSHGMLLNWFLSGARKNVQVQYADAATGDPLYVAGPCVLSKLDHAVKKGERMTAAIALDFSTKPTVTNA